LRCLTIELREPEVDALIREGLLGGELRNDRSAVVEALYVVKPMRAGLARRLPNALSL
jgi:hypothetical protein